MATPIDNVQPKQSPSCILTHPADKNKLTCIKAANSKPLVKNQITGESYPNVADVTSFTAAWSGITALAEAIKLHTSQGHAMLTGGLDRPLINESRAGHSTKEPVSVMVLDIDSDTLPFKTRDAFLQHLGINCSYIYQHSASAARENGLRGHFIIVLDKPTDTGQIKRYLKHLNVNYLDDHLTLSNSQMSIKWPIDLVVNDPGRIIYIAPPIIAKDPIAERIVTVEKEVETFTVPDIDDIDVTPILNALRAEQSLPAKNHTPGTIIEVDPNEVKITGQKEDRDFVYLNLNGGDSWGYFFNPDNPEIVHNFKDEPKFRLKDLDPVLHAKYAIPKINGGELIFCKDDMLLKGVEAAERAGLEISKVLAAVSQQPKTKQEGLVEEIAIAYGVDHDDAWQMFENEANQSVIGEVETIARSVARYEPTLPAELIEGTELAIAHRLKDLADGNIRFVTNQGVFVIWEGNRWILDGNGSGIMRSYELLIQHELNEAMSCTNHVQREAKLKLAIRLQSKKAIDNITSLLKRLPGIPIGIDEFDDNPYLFQVNNGVIDLKTGVFRPAKKEDLCLRRSPVDYDPDALCPEFEALLLWAMSGDPTRVAYLKRLFGYFMVGHAQEEILSIFHGNGANGKSTVREAIRRALGGYAMVAQPTLLVSRDKTAPSNDIARLAGARAVFVSETDENDRLAESTVKYITQQEPISARFLNHEFFEFIPRFKCCLATNHKPTIRGCDEGIWRRIELIPFEKSLPAAERDIHFVDNILVPELPGILAWMVAGAMEYTKVGLNPPASIKSATNEYRDSSDIYSQFFDDCLTIAPNSSVATSKIIEGLEQWHNSNFNESLPGWINTRGLGRWLTDKGYKPYRRTMERGYCGLKLNAA